MTCDGGTENHCLKCDPSILFRVYDAPSKYCICKEGYYEDGSGYCQKCHYSC